MSRKNALLWLFLLPRLNGQTSPIPYDALNGGLSFVNHPAAFTYPGGYSSLRNIDFRSFRFQALDMDGNPYAETYALKNGRWRPPDPADQHRVELTAVYYLPRSLSGQGESALILLTNSGNGGSHIRRRSRKYSASRVATCG